MTHLGVKEVRERCVYCESVRILRGTRDTIEDSEGNTLCNGHWEIERTGFKCSCHVWKPMPLVTRQLGVKNNKSTVKYGYGDLT
jgi:hypothetical protein